MLASSGYRIRIILPALLLSVSGCSQKLSPNSQPPASNETEKKAVIQAMRDWADGYILHDPVRLDRARAADWTYSGDPSGAVVTKPEADKMFQTDTTKYLGFDYEDLNARIYGTAAVVTGREKLRWENAGQTDSASYRITAVFVKQENQWRCVASHSSPITAQK